MTAIKPDTSTVNQTQEKLTADAAADREAAVRRALEHAGCATFDELADQARADRFTSIQAKRAYGAILSWYGLPTEGI